MSFIVLAQQRSGSSFFLDVLRHHPLVDTINEPFSMHLDFFRANEFAWKEEDFLSEGFHRELSPYPETVGFLRDLRQWLNFNYPHIRGFKETALFEKYDWIVKLIQNDHTIVLIRDPRAIVYSVLRRNMQNSWWNYSEKLYLYYGYDEQSVKKMSDIEVCCNLIRERHKIIIDIINKRNPFVVKLEDFLNNPKQILEPLMDYLGLHVSQEQLDFLQETTIATKDSTYSNSRNYFDVVERWKEFFSPSDMELVNYVFQEQLRHFKYL